MLKLINSTKDSIFVETEELSDPGIVEALVKLASHDVWVQVTMTNTANQYANAFDQLTAVGADVAMASADLALMTNDLRRLGTCVRLSRRCRRTIYVNVAIGLGFTFALTALAAAGVLGIEAPIIAALLHNVSTFLGLGNAGRLLLFDETGGNVAAA